jgi:hypothetical protein
MLAKVIKRNQVGMTQLDQLLALLPKTGQKALSGLRGEILGHKQDQEQHAALLAWLLRLIDHA